VNPKGRNNTKDIGVDGGNIRMHFKETEWEIVVRIRLAEDRNQ
jgi:hypothetical protein